MPAWNLAKSPGAARLIPEQLANGWVESVDAEKLHGLIRHHRPKRIGEHRNFWNEQYFLQALLAFNQSFEVVWAAQDMHVHHADALERSIPSYRRDVSNPGSFWTRGVS